MEHNLTGSELTLLSHLVFKHRTNNNIHYVMGNDHPEQLELEEILRKLRTMTNEAFDLEEEGMQRRCEQA